MFLAIDAGNTKVSLGFFEKNTIKDIRHFSCDKTASISELQTLIKQAVSDYVIESCMISSVVDELTENLKAAAESVLNIKPLILSTKINIGLKINVPHPEKCGSDRIANAYAASQLYEKRPVIVVDSGSATTFDIVENGNEFSCGVIMPGMELQLNSLGEKTSKLPILDLNSIPEEVDIISDNTEEAMYAGVVVAHAQAVQGLIKLCENKLNSKAFIAGTGGNIGLISKYMDERKFDDINPNLTLYGIKMLFDLNKNAI